LTEMQVAIKIISTNVTGILPVENASSSELARRSFSGDVSGK
jgi:hypothetical protein